MNQKPARSSAGVQDFRPDAPEAARMNASEPGQDHDPPEPGVNSQE